MLGAGEDQKQEVGSKSWSGIHTSAWAYIYRQVKPAGAGLVRRPGQLCLHRGQDEKLLKVPSSQLEPHQPVFSTKGH